MNFASKPHEESSSNTLPVGVHLYTPTSELQSTNMRLTISKGTVLASQAFRANNSYSEYAYVPCAPWREPQENELKQLWSDAPLHRDMVVGLICLYAPETIQSLQMEIEAVRKLQQKGHLSWSDPFINELLTRIRTWCSVKGPLFYHRIDDDCADLETVSFDPVLGAYVGLHVDAWDDNTTHTVTETRNRICVNLGMEDRFFLFLNQTTKQMRTHLNAHGSESSNTSSPQEVAREFIATFPSYPVIKLRVRPGEAYIAPTNHILHDGSTISVSSRVKHTAFRGYFDF